MGRRAPRYPAPAGNLRCPASPALKPGISFSQVCNICTRLLWGQSSNLPIPSCTCCRWPENVQSEQ